MLCIFIYYESKSVDSAQILYIINRRQAKVMIGV